MTEASSRLRQLVGADGAERLAQSTVTVAGLGAVGSFAVEALARSGLGRLRLIDFDRIQDSNRNRNLFALPDTVGRYKVDAAADRVRALDTGTEVETLRVFIDDSNAGTLLDPAPDCLVDAIDSLNPKTALLEAACRAGIPAVSVMGAATRMDPGCVRVADLAATSGCPLARQVRKRLRRRGVTEGIRCVFSIEPRLRPQPDTPTDAEERLLDRGRPRLQLGSACPLPGMFGLAAAAEVLRLLLDRPAD